MSREEILTAIKGLAEKLGRVPSLEELHTKTAVSRRSVRTHFTMYTNALAELGMETGRNHRIPIDALFQDWAAVAHKLQKLPTYVQYAQNGRFGAKALQARCGRWRRVPHLMLRHAQEHGLEQQWPDVMAMAREDKELNWPATESIFPLPAGPVGNVFTNRPIYGTPMNMCPLAHAPTNEMGVVFLFGVLVRELGYIVTLLQSEYPDCEALRQVMPDKWQRLRIEFEFESRNFLKHAHRIEDCDMIVCWKHNWPECPLEVLELSKMVGKLLPQMNG